MVFINPKKDTLVPVKHLAKYYRPTEKEFIKLVDGFRQMIKLEEQANREVHPDGYKLLKLVDEVVDLTEDKVSDRIKAEQKKQEDEKENRENATGNCPRCNEEVPVKITGEIKIPKTGYTHDLVKCTVCKKEFTQRTPNNNKDYLKWLDHFIKQLRWVEPDGRARWQHIDKTEAALIEFELAFLNLKQAMESEEEAFRALFKAEADLDKTLADMSNELLLMRLKQQQWNGGDAKA